MLAAVELVMPRWSSDVPAWGAFLGSRAFAAEECGIYTVAETCGREALALDPGDIWAAHAVAHVMEMQGRRHEGIRLLQGSSNTGRAAIRWRTISGGTGRCIT
jgi:hypothetical protein